MAKKILRKKRLDWKKLANKEVSSLAALVSAKTSPRTQPKAKPVKKRSSLVGLCINPVNAPTRSGCLVPWGGAMSPSR